MCLCSFRKQLRSAVSLSLMMTRVQKTTAAHWPACTHPHWCQIRRAVPQAAHALSKEVRKSVSKSFLFNCFIIVKVCKNFKTLKDPGSSLGHVFVPQVCLCPPSVQRVTMPFLRMRTHWTVTAQSLSTRCNVPRPTRARVSDRYVSELLI